MHWAKHPRLALAPRVDYQDWEEFANRCAELQNTYTELVQKAVVRRESRTQSFVRPNRHAYPFFTPRDLLLVGLAEFADIRRPGLAGERSRITNCCLEICSTSYKSLYTFELTRKHSDVETHARPRRKILHATQ